MTTQTNSPSPFIDNSNNIPKDLPVSNSEDFSIRTMHDDLISLQKEGRPIEAKVEIKAPQPIIETKKVTTPTTFSQIPVSKNISINKTSPDESKKIEKSDLVEISASKKATANSGVLYKILLGIIVFFVVIIIGLGGYYFFLSNKAIVQTPAEIPLETPSAAPIETPPAVAPSVEKYSATMPNYLYFDPSNETLADLNKTIASIADELKNKNPQSMYEFTVVDSNNNPVLLPIFAAATKFNLSSVLLDNLGENFSIFFYNDNGNIRLAFATTVKDKKIITAEMLKQEKPLVSNTAFLFIEPVSENKLVKFGTSDYNGAPVRYFNFVLNDPDLSIDYIITDSSFVIGTSKNTARATLDKLLEKPSLIDNTSTETGSPINSSLINTTPSPTTETSPSTDASIQK